MLQEDAQLIQEFAVEAVEHLSAVEQQLLEFENPSAPANPERIHNVFRAVHSVKGLSACLGLDTINSLSHQMENVLDKLRHTDKAPESSLVEVLLRCTDKLRILVEDIEASEGVDVQGEIDELIQVFEKPTNVAAAATATLDRVEQLVAQVELRSPSGPAAEAPAAMHAATSKAEPQAAAATAPGPGTPAPSRAAQASDDVTVRVPVAILERLMNLAGELVLSRNQLLRAVATRRKTGIETISARLDQVTTEMQEAIMCSRMQQVGTVFSRFPRLVRDLCKKLDKQCNLVVEGSDVELDKTILEAVADPLTHLLRNSLDHGIEAPKGRLAADKPAAGTLVLRAFHQAGKVNITLSDDGAGVNRKRVLEKAISKGIINPARAATMTDRDVVALLFEPGFSTAEVVTDVSGRGVGMDVVKTNIEKLGGTVEIDSTPGKGTEVRVSLPLTLAIIPSLIVCDHGIRLALPETSITELVRLTANDAEVRIERLHDAEVLRLRGRLLPLVRLGSLLQSSRGSAASASAVQPRRKHPPREPGATRAAHHAPPATPSNVIIVESGATKFALAVDQVLDAEQIVVKPLGRHLRGFRFLAGTTVLGDGNIAFILDIVGLGELARLATSAAVVAKPAVASAEGPETETQTTLLFRNGRQELLGVPMAMIARIERINGHQIQSVDGRLLLTYRGACLPLMHLAGDRSEDLRRRHDCYVLVFQIDTHEIGLIVPHLVDIRDVSLEVDAEFFADSSVMGTVLIGEEIARLIDPVELVAAAAPDTVKALRQRPKVKLPKKVMLVEDSRFFRQQVQRFLEAEKLEVVAFEDGVKAWKALESGRFEPDLIVTDIEMPNMNGYELCRRIRGSDRWQSLPVIALSALTGEEHLRRGREVGFTDYQVKMDREHLSQAVHQLLAEVGF